MYSGELPTLAIQSECRCRGSHPRVNPSQTTHCIPNGVPDNLGDELLRLNNESHPLQYLSDGDSNSYWVSSFTSDVMVTVDLGDQFQVQTGMLACSFILEALSGITILLLLA